MEFIEDEYFEHDYEDEEQLFNVLQSHKNLVGTLQHIRQHFKDANQLIRMTYQNKREELNYLYESQTKELQRAATLDQS